MTIGGVFHFQHCGRASGRCAFAAIDLTFRTHSTQQLFITADARLDNRDELAVALGVAGNQAREWSDAQLILEAYARWDERAPEYLLGDFAFAIWDAPRQTLFCARDHFGVRPFYYHTSSARFTFASELRTVLESAKADAVLDEEWVAAFLAGMEESASATAYRSIQRLPAGHWVTASERGVRVQRYFALKEPQIADGRSADETAEAFSEIFAAAVKARLTPAKDVGCMLSGGLDSSSICCVARTLAAGRVRTFSRTYPAGSESDESGHIAAVLRLGGFEPHSIPASSTTALPALSRLCAEQGEPTFAPGLFANGELYPVARAHGCTVLLDGHGGDEVLSMGRRFLFELAEADRWVRVGWEMAPLLVSDGRATLAAAGSLLASCGFAGRLRRRLALRSRLRTASPEASRPRWSAAIASDFFRSSRLGERRAAWRILQPETAATERSSHFRTLTDPSQTRALEILHRAAAAHGVEGRFPFWDRRVVEFCLTVPSGQKFARGWNRAVLRRAMKGTLPETVRRRRDKANFAGNLRAALALDGLAAWEERVLCSTGGLSRFADLAWTRARLRALTEGRAVEADELFALCRVAALGLWLAERPALIAHAAVPAAFSILKP